ncbi:hypothetical protein LTR94_033183, partial [Friedmanniomyces endolithicus]
MKDGFYDTHGWLEARINLAFADATISSDPTSPNYPSLMIDNIETARQWMAEIAKDTSPSTLIEFVTDDDELIQEAFDWLNANDPPSTMRTFNLAYPHTNLLYVV